MASSPPQRFGTLRILWGALFSSTLVYLVVLSVITMPDAAEPTGGAFFGALMTAALVSTIASFLYPNYLFRVGIDAKELAVEEIPDPEASVMFRDAAPMMRVFVSDRDAWDAAVRSAYTPAILRFALSESVAIYGFLLAITGADRFIYLPFFIIAWVLFAAHFPSEARLRAAVEKAKDARFRNGE